MRGGGDELTKCKVLHLDARRRRVGVEGKAREVLVVREDQFLVEREGDVALAKMHPVRPRGLVGRQGVFQRAAVTPIVWAVKTAMGDDVRDLGGGDGRDH